MDACTSQTKRARSNSLSPSAHEDPTPHNRPRLELSSEAEDESDDPEPVAEPQTAAALSPETSSKASDEVEEQLSEAKEERSSIKGKEAARDSIEKDHTASSHPVLFANGDWQAVYDPQHAAYYFANSRTGETTWTNPLTSTSSSSVEDANKASISQVDLGGIDPELAYLDPQCARAMSSRGGQDPPTFAARFNAKTGRFESDPSHDPSRVSQYARARTQAGAYFDVDGWEKSLEQNNGRITGTARERQTEAIKNGQRLSKAELARFKEKKNEKKAQRQRAWLAG